MKQPVDEKIVDKFFWWNSNWQNGSRQNGIWLKRSWQNGLGQNGGLQNCT